MAEGGCVMASQYQISMHAASLRRWFSPEDAMRKAAYFVNSGACWKYAEPAADGNQLRLFA
jgi:hypothetical protein